MDSGNASVEVVHGVEDGGVGVGDLGGESERFRGGDIVLCNGKVLDCGCGPDGPVAEQAADNADVLATEIEPGQQVKEDVVVIAGVESNFLGAPGLREGPDHVECVVTIERSDLDGGYVFDLEELAPEFVRKDAASDRGLKIEAYDRDQPGDGAGVVYEFKGSGITKIGEAE